jgi:hypothetical protein
VVKGADFEALKASDFIQSELQDTETWFLKKAGVGLSTRAEGRGKAENAKVVDGNNPTLVASLSTDSKIATFFEARQDREVRDDNAIQDVRPEYPSWYQPYANDKTLYFRLITPTFGEMDFTLNSFPMENTAMMPGHRDTRKFYRTDHCNELIKGYCVFGLFANMHHSCKFAFVAYTRLLPKPEYVREERVQRFGEVVYVRAFVTMCNKPRVDHAIYGVNAKTVTIWQGYNLIKMYTCDMEEPLSVSIKDIDIALANYYGTHLMYYKPETDGLRM